jgi:small-conductance mechanosensitive channel
MFEQITNLQFWSYEFLGNSIFNYIKAVLIFVGVMILIKVFQFLVKSKIKKFAKRSKTEIDDQIIKVIEKIKPIFYIIVALYFAVKVLVFPTVVLQILNVVVILVLVYQISISLSVFVDFVLDNANKKEVEGSTKTAIQLAGKILKGVIWIIAVLLALSNFGVNVTSLIAGLGIGGIAVALAAQNILGDLFSSFVIYFDKPFVVGDFIVVGDKVGTVEKIGIKTTRIKALNGEEIVISNTQLTSAEIQNFKKMNKRRGSFKFGVTYDTSTEDLKSIPKVVEEIINEVDGVEFDRGFFESFGDSAIVFEVVYYVEKPDYNFYVEKNQNISIELKKRLNDKGIEMAFPTQTIYLKNEKNGE